MRAAIYGYGLKQESFHYIQELLSSLSRNNIPFSLHDKLFNIVKSENWLNNYQKDIFTDDSDLHNIADVLIGLGGDGTILNSVSLIKACNIPVIGINLGRLGFLANISKDNISKAIDAIAEQKYSIENRALIEIKNMNGLKSKVALNEISVQKSGSEMINVQVYLNNEYLNTYWADGLLIATPTGSTAYSLSVGGPIIVPGAKNLVISPISPHTLTVRPLIIPDSMELRLKISARNEKFLLSLDHNSFEITENQEIVLGRAVTDLKLMQIEGVSFYKTLREKLMWGVDKRN